MNPLLPGNTPTAAVTPIPPDDLDYRHADLKVLAIGHSYSYNALYYLTRLAEHEGHRIKAVNLYHSGCSLGTHCRYGAANAPEYQYQLGSRMFWQSAVTMQMVVNSDRWDVITFQQAPDNSCLYSSYQPSLNTLIGWIREVQPQAKLMLHETWGFGDGYPHFTALTGSSMAENWPRVKAAYHEASADTGLPLIPAGEAVWRAQQALNARGKGELIHADCSHLDTHWGYYTAALVWYRTLLGITPGNTFNEFDGDVTDDPELRARMYRAAMEAVEEEYPDLG